MMNALSRWLHSLQAQLILWAILPVTLALIALAFTGVYAHQYEMRDFVAERNLILARITAIGIEDGITGGLIAPDGGDLAGWLPILTEELSGQLLVIDGEARVLAHTDSRLVDTVVGDVPGIADALQRREGMVTIPDGPEGAVLATFSPVHGTNWVVVIQEPVEGIIGPILRFSGLGPIAAFVAIGISLIIFAFGWRTIVRPLQRLAQAMEQVSWGDHEVIHRPVGGVAEIRELHQALEAMVDRIQGYEDGVHDYLGAVTQGQESERARLALELHDGAVQELIALGQRLEMARRMIERGEAEPARALLDDLRTRQVATVEELRRIIGDLRPVYLDDLGFLPALEMLVRSVDSRSETHVRLEYGSGLRRLSPDVELAAYRVTQEALNNALHHAQAQNVVVSVYCDAEGLTLTIADDGIGFDLTKRPELLTQAGHFGLVGLQERVRHMNGSLRIRTAPGAGTSLIARFPECPEISPEVT
jgi:signal transduction histidine kinase